jgi:hypothetical protein
VIPFEDLLVVKHIGKAAVQLAGDFLFTDRGGAIRSGYALRRTVVDAVPDGTPGGAEVAYRDLRHWQEAFLSQHRLDGDDATTQMLAKMFAHGARVGDEVYGSTRDITRKGTPPSLAVFHTHCGWAQTLFGVPSATGPAGTRPPLPLPLPLPCIWSAAGSANSGLRGERCRRFRSTDDDSGDFRQAGRPG